MYVNKESVSIEESNIVLGIKVKVTYFTLPNMPFAGLTRKVSVENLNQVNISQSLMVLHNFYHLALIIVWL